MRPGGWISGLLAAAIVGALWLPAADSAPTGQEGAVRRVANAGLERVLAGDARGVCALLTPRARRNSILDSHYVDGHPRSRRTCESAVGFLIRQERSGDRYSFGRLSRNPSLAGFRVLRIRGGRALVRLHVREIAPGGADVGDIAFVRTARGWRADHATFSPFDGSSGE